MADKRADLAGPGISTYPEVEKILPNDYNSLLNRKETQKGIYAIKRFIEDGLARELNLQLVQVPLIVERAVKAAVVQVDDHRSSRCWSQNSFETPGRAATTNSTLVNAVKRLTNEAPTYTRLHFMFLLYHHARQTANPACRTYH